MITFTVDSDRCISCGLCASDCPSGIITTHEIPRMTDENRCIKCQHCMAVCPTAAVSILGHNPDEIAPVKVDESTVSNLESLIRSRRSIRKYKDEDLDQSVIDALLQTVWYAPTGVNSKKILFTVMSSKDAVHSLRDEIYSRINVLVQEENMPDSLSGKYLSFATKAWYRNKDDVIFRGAPHVLIASAPKDTACPLSDTHIALSYFELLAQAQGIGTLWDGMLLWALKDILPDLTKRLGIPADHMIGNVMVFGKPAVKYGRSIEPGKVNVHSVTQWVTESADD